jgi:hypothetical protein
MRKTMNRFSKHKWWMLTVVLTAPVVATAAGGLKVFVAGTVISAEHVNDNFKKLADRLTALEGAVKPLATYVRWGRSVCPTGANVVYKGYAAGGHWNNPGSGADTLCLSEAPTWLGYDDADLNGATIFGTEYATAGHGVPSLAAVDDRDANCVVCEVPRSTRLMIPGQTGCPATWTLEYAGYLMSAHFQNHRQDWICVDAAPEAAGSSAALEGHMLYPTEAECGSLPCQAGGYVQNREVTCAVCTK